MPKRSTMKRAAADRRRGESASSQAGKFVREEIEEIRAGKHGARSAKQAIAIGLSKARRAGVDLPPPKKGTTSKETRRKAKRELERGRAKTPVSRKRSRATTKVLKREGTAAASKTALSRQAHSVAKRRTKSERSAIARKAARTRAANRRSSPC